jgi:hypothetical protein
MVTMKKLTILIAFIAGGLILTASPGLSQQGSSTPSLGEYAKQVRAERAKEGEKPAKLYTNDNIPRSGSLSEVGPTLESGAKGDGKAGAASEGTGETASGAHDEKYYREAMKDLQSQKDMHERELAVLEQKLSLNSTQYYNDPNKTLQQEYSRTDINKKQDEIDKKKQQIADDEKAIADLEAQCAREACPPGWLR